ncbi:PAS domain S-box protein [Desulfovibrio sp. JC010]|uniref:PAS domain-containing hybrid sensor histidine kinase/response regulator n=1 Tax=Desulfovibrio sp. JC010 TaxID=2593641 RepID=UPI0013D2595B|nr:PAS domain S-box protein [Desulfovibrio sp. JC010]NDV26720.1 PAS domain S-box protein [Desulfovibrio sp. JC010]
MKDQEIKNTPKELEYSEERYRRLADATFESIFISDKGICLEQNSTAQRMFGYTDDEAVGRAGTEWIVPEDRETVIQNILNNYEEPYEVTALRKDGTTFHCEIQGRTIHEGEKTLRVTALRDISARKRAEEQMRDSEHRHRLIFEHSPHGMIRFDKTGTIIDCNRKFIELMGADKEKLIGFNSIRHSNPKMSAAVKKATQGQTSEYEDFYTSVTGNKTSYIRAVFNPVEKGANPTEVIASLEDITARRQMEKNLAKTESRFKTIAENSKDLIYRFSVPNKKFEYVSPSCLDITGFPPGTFYENSQFFFDLIHPDFQDFMHQQWLDMAYGKMEPLVEYRIIDRYGKTKWLQQSNVPLYDKKGNPVRVEGIVRDVTELKNALERVEQERARAEAASNTKSEFLANMSHEIRTPLNGIMGMLQLMDADEPPAQQGEYINAAMQASRRLNNVLSDILDLARVEAGKLSLCYREFNPAEELKHVFELFEVTSRHSGVKLELRLAADLPRTVIGDSARLQQILTNIVGNALKFTHDGHVVIDAILLPHFSDGKSHLLFSVEDTGVGIPENKMDVLFQSFTQVNQGYTRQYQGAGLGLSICKRLVELMDGSISIESTAGEGTTFHVSIPFALPESEKLFPEERDAEPKIISSFEQYRILVAEDEKINRLYTKRYLEQLGFTVETVTDGQQVVDKLFYEDFNLVLMDVQMPVRNGLEATEAIRMGEAGAHNKRIPIIAITAYAMQGDRDQFIEKGMDDYIAKPVEEEELRKVILKILQLS